MNDTLLLTHSADHDERYRVSIIVPTFNRAQYIEECLDSLLAQTVPAYEIIVIDDGSDDDTPARVASYGSRLRYVRKENGGKPSAVNLALTLVEGNLVWLFDDDDVALPDAIERRIETLESCPDAGFVYSPHYLGSNGADGRIVRGQLHETPYYGNDRFFFELMKGCFFHLATALVRTDVYRAAGAFDMNLLRSQDYDMQIRIAQHATATFCPSPTFIFRQHPGIRGPKAIRSPGAKRSAVFQAYDQLVGRKLKANIPLCDYRIPRGEMRGTDEQRRDALLSRMLVMASKGCIPEMIEDLTDAITTFDAGGQLTAKEAKLISNTLSTGYAYRACRENWAEFLQRLRKVVKYPQGRRAVSSMAHGLLVIATSYPGTLRERSRRLLAAASLVRLLYLDMIDRWKSKQSL